MSCLPSTNYMPSSRTLSAMSSLCSLPDQHLNARKSLITRPQIISIYQDQYSMTLALLVCKSLYDILNYKMIYCLRVLHHVSCGAFYDSSYALRCFFLWCFSFLSYFFCGVFSFHCSSSLLTSCPGP